jgi:hypothetical protein
LPAVPQNLCVYCFLHISEQKLTEGRPNYEGRRKSSRESDEGGMSSKILFGTYLEQLMISLNSKNYIRKTIHFNNLHSNVLKLGNDSRQNLFDSDIDCLTLSLVLSSIYILVRTLSIS